MPDFPLPGLRAKTPVVVGSGRLTGQERTIRRLLAQGAGAVVTQTIHPCPPEAPDERILRLPVGMLGSTACSRRPVDHWLRMLRSLADESLPVIASVHADSPAELGMLARAVEITGCPGVELGVSCVDEESGLEDDSPQRVYDYTSETRCWVELPLSVRLAVGEGLEDRVHAAIAGGADAVTISPRTGGPEPGETSGHGCAGPGAVPPVLAAVRRLRKRGFALPIAARGGVTSGRDVVDYLRAGADVVQVDTAPHTDAYGALRSLVTGTERLLTGADTDTARSAETAP
ncbi:glutamate synthase-related protein [Streptomyces sp. NPDC007983]|uniref:glutamate synthase-related protein n=1 Tax=Streptomyces sp. NPDC007983 TaxID=3364800 RepID=UPI0036EE3CBA